MPAGTRKHNQRFRLCAGAHKSEIIVRWRTYRQKLPDQVSVLSGSPMAQVPDSSVRPAAAPSCQEKKSRLMVGIKHARRAAGMWRRLRWSSPRGSKKSYRRCSLSYIVSLGAGRQFRGRGGGNERGRTVRETTLRQALAYSKQLPRPAWPLMYATAKMTVEKPLIIAPMREAFFAPVRGREHP